MVMDRVTTFRNGSRPKLRCPHEEEIERLHACLRRQYRAACLLLAACAIAWLALIVALPLMYRAGRNEGFERNGVRRGEMERTFSGDRGGEHE